ncbi:MAG: DNA topoisomerase IV subunit B [Alphaproteobacteria bacterium]|nr:DNA topoisomerase IV subunit B [Alphaproteobacteria bacterium]
MSDLFSKNTNLARQYTAEDIEVLEGLEPVRHRPGMYIGGTDQTALHHLVVELMDNSMDEAVAGHASRIEVELHENGSLSVRDNGRGIPVDAHPKYPDRSALEVILTTLHSGGKFRNNVYETAGGLHGVGVSVVNALSSSLVVEVARDKVLWRQIYKQGVPMTPLENMGSTSNRRGTSITFSPDPEIFKETCTFSPKVLYRLVRSKAYLHRGVEVRWACHPSLLKEGDRVPVEEKLCFPGGLDDFLKDELEGKTSVVAESFVGRAELADNEGRIEWAISWVDEDTEGVRSYCNTVPTPQGGTHENGLRQGLTRSLKSFAEMVGHKKAGQITADDVVTDTIGVLSLFIRNPQFQGQTKEKLVNQNVTRWVENAIKDHFDHWLSGNKLQSEALLEYIVERSDERLKRKSSRETARKTATQRLRLPGKLADCISSNIEETELFLVEGESAGGSAKQARDRHTQAILPLRGKILNVANATDDKMNANREVQDMAIALGCKVGKNGNLEGLRYGKVIIMTDADVDGAHIAALLMTFFFQQMRPLIERGHLYLAQPPLFRLTHGTTSVYAKDEEHRQELLKTVFKGKTNVDTSRFKGLGEMPWTHLRDTTMSPKSRKLLRVCLPGQGDDSSVDISKFVDDLMGKKPEKRFAFITENAKFIEDLDV